MDLESGGDSEVSDKREAKPCISQQGHHPATSSPSALDFECCMMNLSSGGPIGMGGLGVGELQHSFLSPHTHVANL